MSLQKNVLKKSLKILFVLWSSFLLESCSTSVPDVVICKEIHPTKGFCVKTLSSVEFEVTEQNKWNDKTWWEQKVTMLLLPVESWVEIKSFIIKICKKSEKCSGPDITNWERTVETVDTKIVRKK